MLRESGVQNNDIVSGIDRMGGWQFASSLGLFSKRNDFLTSRRCHGALVDFTSYLPTAVFLGLPNKILTPRLFFSCCRNGFCVCERIITYFRPPHSAILLHIHYSLASVYPLTDKSRRYSNRIPLLEDFHPIREPFSTQCEKCPESILPSATDVRFELNVQNFASDLFVLAKGIPFPLLLTTALYIPSVAFDDKSSV